MSLSTTQFKGQLLQESRETLLLETHVRIARSVYHPSPVRSLLKQRLHKLYSHWSYSKPTWIKQNDRLVQISDPSCVLELQRQHPCNWSRHHFKYVPCSLGAPGPKALHT